MIPPHMIIKISRLIDPDMPSFVDLPAEIRRRIMAYLPIRDKFSASEADSSMDEVNEMQLETSSNFKIKGTKTIVGVVINETRCQTAVKMALKRYKEVHLMVARSIVEDNREEAAVKLKNWLAEVTRNGRRKATSVEIFGYIYANSGIWGSLAKYCRTLVITHGQEPPILVSVLYAAGQAKPRRKVVYDGEANLVELMEDHQKWEKNVQLRVCKSEIFSEPSQPRELIDALENKLEYYEGKRVKDFVPDVKFGIRLSREDPDDQGRDDRALDCALNVICAFATLVR